MPATVQVPAATSVGANGQLYRLSVEQYHRMGEAGILTPSDRVVLIEGLLVRKMTQNPPHITAVTQITRALARLLPEDWVVRPQGPITTATSEPEPDFCVAIGTAGRYATRHPTTGDIALVIEVSDSTLAADRDMARVYAGARIPVYWIVNIPDDQVEVYTQPRGGRNPGYRQRQDFPRDGAVPLVLGGQTFGPLPARDLLPPRP